ncbi:GNAT family N-acetyltransferase [Acidihalobacter prosperus]|uniref:GNAT family N-acetyltransferase n=1 Tax=Acidihalobacter prosperus TaxID=160660 RepID=UPI00191C072F|nr:GNAT family N-acetyltransferase [Acidihalobacter prosperus]
MPTVEELLALDLLTLRELTELAGDRVDPEQHAANLRESLRFASLRFSRTCAVRRNDLLVAYAMLNQVSGSSWFVRGFNTHPEHRSAPVLRELLEQVSELARRESITELRSHVYKTNRLSMAFHRRLGFRVTKENAKGVEFFAMVEDLASNPAIERMSYRRLRRRQAAAHVERLAAGCALGCFQPLMRCPIGN